LKTAFDNQPGRTTEWNGPSKTLLPEHVPEAVFQEPRVNFPYTNFTRIAGLSIRFAFGRAFQGKEGLSKA
jgi:hypothetical protein